MEEGDTHCFWRPVGRLDWQVMTYLAIIYLSLFYSEKIAILFTRGRIGFIDGPAFQHVDSGRERAEEL
jgi:hypothetical protein